MSTDLIVALSVPWVFWGALIGWLIAAGRSWINMLIIPVGITVLLLIVAAVQSARLVFLASVILHLFILIYFLGSYISFVLLEKREKR